MSDVTKGEKLMCVENPAMFDDGETVAFTIRGETGKQLRINCSLAEIGDICSFLGFAAKAAAESRHSTLDDPKDTHNYLSPIPAQGTGFTAGSDSTEAIIVMRLFGFDLAFSVPSSGLVALSGDIARIAKTLSAQGKVH
jgi:hypothetical protein